MLQRIATGEFAPTNLCWREGCPAWKALGCGHFVRAQIKRAKGGALAGAVALVGLTLGYVAVTKTAYSIFLPAASSYDVEAETIKLDMRNDARLIAQAAAQHFLEAEDRWVLFSYDRSTGKETGPLAVSVSRIRSGYTLVPKQLTRNGTFQLLHPRVGVPLTFSSGGRLVE